MEHILKTYSSIYMFYVEHIHTDSLYTTVQCHLHALTMEHIEDIQFNVTYTHSLWNIYWRHTVQFTCSTWSTSTLTHCTQQFNVTYTHSLWNIYWRHTVQFTCSTWSTSTLTHCTQQFNVTYTHSLWNILKTYSSMSLTRTHYGTYWRHTVQCHLHALTMEHILKTYSSIYMFYVEHIHTDSLYTTVQCHLHALTMEHIEDIQFNVTYTHSLRNILKTYSSMSLTRTNYGTYIEDIQFNLRVPRGVPAHTQFR